MSATATTIDWNARARSCYLDPSATAARLATYEHGLARLSQARYMLDFTRSPRARFGLQSQDIPASVVEVIESTISELAHVGTAHAKAVRALAARYRAMMSEGYAQDTIWTILEDEGSRELGYQYGDGGALLAVSGSAS